MPRIDLEPKNQCTLDDPTDGADSPSPAPSGGTEPLGAAGVATSSERGAACLERDAGAEGSGGGCADALVQRFASGGAGSPATEPQDKECGTEWLSLLGNCGRVVVELLERKPPEKFEVINCAGSASALAKCEFGGD